METSRCAYADINGIKMYYEVYGEGELPLILIHGGGSTIQSNFEAILPYLADYGRIVAVELQAHGRTSDRDAPESFEQDAADVAALLKHLEIKKANFLGYSNGGTTVLQLATTYHHIVNKIIAISATYLREGLAPQLFDGLQQATFNNIPGMLKEAFLKVNSNEAKLKVMFEKDRQRMLDFRDMDENLLQVIKAPALIVGSDNDVVQIAHTTKIAKTIPSASLAIFPGLHGEFLGDIFSYKKGSDMPRAAAIMFKEFLRE